MFLSGLAVKLINLKVMQFHIHQSLRIGIVCIEFMLTGEAPGYKLTLIKQNFTIRFFYIEHTELPVCWLT